MQEPSLFSDLDALEPRDKRPFLLRYVQTENDGQPVLHKQHGMPEYEPMVLLRVGGVNYHFPDTSEGHAVVAGSLLELWEGPSIPSTLQRYCEDVFLTTQSNASDEYWSEVYGLPEFRSQASASPNTVVVYNSHLLTPGLAAHEMAHNLAHALWGDSTPPAGSEFRSAIDSGEPPPSAYAAVHPREDFAEAVELFVEGRLRSLAPLRYNAVERILRGGNDGS